MEGTMDRDRTRQIAIVGVLGLVALVGAFWVWWPLGVTMGLVVGASATFVAGRAMQRSAALESDEDAFAALFDES
jgi:Flp pilus assembly protein TadB